MAKALNAIVERVRRYEIATLVIGMPYLKDGGATPQSEKVSALIERLKTQLEASGLRPDIVTVNEFRSTVEAVVLYPKAEPDAAAAALILQNYLDANE
jgi:RNase H-fold protein (predicted Holliday junction resolvase)